MVLRLHVVGASLILRLSTEETGEEGEGGGRRGEERGGEWRRGEGEEKDDRRKGEQRLLKSDLHVYTCSLEQWDNDCMH